MSKVTIADVALAAGLSKTAVSFALNDNWQGKLSREAAERAKEAAIKLGYRPNFAARTLRNQVTASVGFLSTEVSVTRFAMDMISGAISSANELGHALLVGETSPKQHVRDKDHAQVLDRVSFRDTALSALLDRQIDGLVVAEMGAKQITNLDIPKNLPVVYLNCRTEEPCSSILPDEKSAGRELVNTLASSQKVAKVLLLGSDQRLETDPSASITIGDRLTAIRTALRAHDIESLEIESPSWTSQFGYEGFINNFVHYKPDAVIALNDQIGFGVYQACLEMGLKVGEDLSVVSFDDDELSRLLRPALTTASLPYEQMGRLAVELLLSGDLEKREYRVSMPIRHRDSIIKNRGRV